MHLFLMEHSESVWSENDWFFRYTEAFREEGEGGKNILEKKFSNFFFAKIFLSFLKPKSKHENKVERKFFS